LPNSEKRLTKITVARSPESIRDENEREYDVLPVEHD
jgi:hypothetical protein